MILTKQETIDSILILGMHRSGTSAVTRLLNLMGVDLGENLLAPQDDNVTGFWEQSDIVAVNDKLLVSIGSDWSDVRDLREQWWNLEALKPYRREIKGILNKEFSDGKLWGVKDPRICRLLPFYLPIMREMNRNPACIMVLRNPLEVAGSLHVRNGMSIEHALLLWLKYMLEAERNSRGIARAWVSYDSLLNDWKGAMRLIIESLPLGTSKLNLGIGQEVDGFLNSGLRHHRFGSLNVSALTSSWVKSVYDAMRAAETGDGKIDLVLLDRIGHEMSEAKLLYEPVIAEFIADINEKEEKLGSLHDGIAERDGAITALHDEIGALRGGIAERDQSLRLNQLALEQLSAELTEKRQLLESIRTSRSWQITLPLRVTARLLRHGVNYPQPGIYSSQNAKRLAMALH